MGVFWGFFRTLRSLLMTNLRALAALEIGRGGGGEGGTEAATERTGGEGEEEGSEEGGGAASSRWEKAAEERGLSSF